MSKRRQKKDDRQLRDEATESWNFISHRCGDQLSVGLKSAVDAGIIVEEFISEDFPCESCPNFLTCLLKDRLM